jgi:phosphate:Na+ symporter
MNSETSSYLSYIINILTLIGSLGLFLFGMKIMSEALQKVAGVRMRSILATITSNRTRSILSGLLITTLIQSSSATTVMIVSFVNAGLLSLFESIGVIMGANIGTTVTAWLVSLLGFNLKISSLAIPLIGLGFPLIFSRRNTRKSWGEFLIGFALIFIGLEFLKTTVPDISAQPELVGFVSKYTGIGLWTTLIFYLTGIVITILIQSSSAAMALTFVMCYRGWIDFELAAAMILGENIGTTITANLAALVANSAAKRSALSHFIFNLIGTIWALALLKPILHGVDLIITGAGKPSPFSEVVSIPVALAIFHTSFNLVNTFLLVGFMKQIEQLTTWIIKGKKDSQELFRLKHFKTGLVSISELSILQARKEIALYAHRTHKMFKTVRELFTETNEEKYQYLYQKIEYYEQIIDNMEIEIASYLTNVSEGELSFPGTVRIKAMLKLVDEIENIGDASHQISRAIQRKKTEKIWFSQDLRNNLNAMFDLLEKAFGHMLSNLETDYKNVNLEKVRGTEVKINALRTDLKQEHLNNIENRSYKYQAGVIYNDILALCERMGDHIYNISTALSESNPPEK